MELLTKDDVRTTWDAVNASACGKVKKIGLKEYVEMGYDYLVLSTEVQFKEDYYSGNLKGYGWIDIEQTSRIEFQLDLAGFYEYLTQSDAKISPPSLDYLDITIVDQGYNRHRNEFCSLKAGNESEDYIREHVETVAQKLDSVGMKMTLSGKSAYKLLMEPNSELHLQFKPEVSFTFTDFGYYDERETRELLGLTVEINQQLYSNLVDNWALDRFNRIETREIATKSEQTKNRFFENIIVRRNFHLEDKNSMNNFINSKIKVVKLDGKNIEGVLQKNENQDLVIVRNINGGTISTVINVKQIKEFSVYR